MAYSNTVGTWHIYIITNMVNGKKYVGLTNSLSKRWNKHKNAKGSAPALHSAIKKYGIENFDFVHYASAFGPDAAKTIEIAVIAEYNTQVPNGYNLTAGGDGTLEPSPDLRQRLSDSHKGKAQSEETKRKRSESLKKAYAEGRRSPRSGWKLSDEAKLKLSESKKGNKNPMYGKRLSKEHSQKISEATRGLKKSDEAVANQTAAQRLRRSLERAKAVGGIQ
jgi:group I intron endonuclease